MATNFDSSKYEETQHSPNKETKICVEKERKWGNWANVIMILIIWCAVEESETESEESDVSGSDGDDTSWISVSEIGRAHV